MKLISRRIILLITSIFMLSGIAHACSCVTISDFTHTIAATTNIAILKLVSVDKTQGPVDYNHPDGVYRSKLRIEKVYKGNLPVGTVLNFAVGQACTQSFGEKIGSEFLAYFSPHPRSGFFERDVCSRTSPIEYAAADLLYLEKADKVRGKTRLSGTLRRSGKYGGGPWELLANWTVTVSGNGQTISLKTDKNGVYEVYDLPPGWYEAEPAKLDGYRIAWPVKTDSVGANVLAGKHAEANISFSIDSEIRGRVVDKNDQPLTGACVSLIAADGSSQNSGYQPGACSKADGIFVLDTIPAGSYLLAVNGGGKPTASQPFSTTYYPGTFSRGEAIPVNVEPGTHRVKMDIKVPEILETIELRGIVLDLYGHPVNNARVRFYEDANDPRAKSQLYTADYDFYTRTDGRFSLRIVKGQKGVIFASTDFLPDGFDDCRLADEIFKAHGWFQPETQIMEINAETALEGIELKLQLPAGCD